MGENDYGQKLSEIHTMLGRLDERSQNTHEYIKSVSEGQKTLRRDFDAHVNENEKAHGGNVTEKRDSKWISILALGTAAATALWKAVEKMGHQ